MKTAPIFFIFLCIYSTSSLSDGSSGPKLTKTNSFGGFFNKAKKMASIGGTALANSAIGIAKGVAKGAKKVANSVSNVLQSGGQLFNKVSLDTLAFMVNNTMELAVSNGVFTNQCAARLYSTFANEFGYAEPYTEQEIAALSLVDVMAPNTTHTFISSLSKLMILKNNGTSTYALLGGFEVALLHLLATQKVISRVLEDAALNSFGMTKMGELIDSAVKLMTDLKDHFSHKAPEVYHHLTDAVHQKLSTCGTLTKSAMVKALQGVLNMAADKVILAQNATRLAASFGIENNATALKLDEVNDLVLLGQEDIPNQILLSKIKTALKSVSSKGVTVNNLLSITAAFLDALTVNKFMDASVALRTMSFFNMTPPGDASVSL